jgi:hypothetical protein
MTDQCFSLRQESSVADTGLADERFMTVQALSRLNLVVRARLASIQEVIVPTWDVITVLKSPSELPLQLLYWPMR